MVRTYKTKGENKLTDEKAMEIKTIVEAGTSIRQAARDHNVSEGTIHSMWKAIEKRANTEPEDLKAQGGQVS